MKPTMHRTAAFCSLTLLSLAAWSEEVPVPAPAPAAAEPTAPAPVAAEPGAAPAAEVPAPAPAPAPAPKTKTDDVVFNNPNRNPAAPPVQRQFGFGATLGAGYDSNILLENSSTPQATEAKGLALTGEVRAQVRLVDKPKARLGVFGTAEVDDYPSESSANLFRYGVGFTAGTSIGGFDPGLVVGYNRFYIDHEGEATAFNVNAYVAKVLQRYVCILALDSQYVDYDNNAPATGTLYDVAYRQWFLLQPGKINRRIELGVKGGKNFTEDPDQAYTTITPWLGMFWRVGDKPAFGTQDIAARLGYEMRRYPDPASGGEAQRQENLSFTSSYDYWLRNWLAAGGYFAYSERSSNIDIFDYNRVQVGFRLTGAW